MYQFKYHTYLFQSTGTIQKFPDLAAYRPVSIKRPDLIFLQKSLLKVRYDRKNPGLSILSTRSCNRMVRVHGNDKVLI